MTLLEMFRKDDYDWQERRQTDMERQFATKRVKERDDKRERNIEIEKEIEK